MARIRTIKPDYFNSFDIASMTPLSRLFYAYLWTESDREGLLEWKPNNFRMRFFPTDQYEISDLENELIENNLIELFEDDDGVICLIKTFKNHQVINNREAESILISRVKDACTRVKAEGKEGREGKGKEGKDNVAKATSENTVSTIKVPFKEIIKKWNDFADQHQLPKCVKQTKSLEGQIRQRWKDDLPELSHWDNYLSFIGQSKFLTGRTSNGDRKPFRATLAWITKESNFAKIAAEQYHE